MDINQAYAQFLMNETNPVLKQDCIDLVMGFMTDLVEGGWSAAELFGAGDGTPGVVRQLRGRKVVNVTPQAVMLESGEAMAREPQDKAA